MPDEGVFCPECGAKQEPQQAVTPAYEETPVYAEAPVYEETPVSTEEPVYEEAPVYAEAPIYAEAPVYEEAPVYCDADSKICERCGAVIPLDSRFCPECRARQGDVAPMNGPRRVVDPAQLTRAAAWAKGLITPKMKEAFHKYKKWIAVAAGGVLAVCLILLVVSAFLKPRINLNKYVTVYAEGYDGYGYAQVEFDLVSFYEDHGKNLARVMLAKNGEESKSGLLSNNEASKKIYAESCDTFLEECVDANLFNGELLHEGDVFTLQWNCKDATALNRYGYKLRYEDIEYTVKSLQKIKEFDPFEGIEVVFEGIGPDGRAYLEGKAVAPAAQEMRYNLDIDDELSNGDKVTIEITSRQSDLAQYCIENYGMLPTSLTKEVTVTGLDSYVTQNAQISAEALATMQQQAADAYNARMAKNPQAGEKLVAFDYLGNYLLVNKDREMFGGEYNRLYLVFKIQMSNQYSSSDSRFDKVTDLYWYICFENVLVDDTGITTVDLASYDLPKTEIEIDSGISTGRYDTKTWEYSGYETLDEMYTAVVAVNVEAYICDSTVKAG